MIANKLVNSVNGPMIINSNDQYIGRSKELTGGWAIDDVALIESFCEIILADKGSMRLYDVGANIGSHTVALAKKFADRIAVRSFEAQRQVYYMLCGNVAMNGLDNVHCEYAAVSDGSRDSLSIALPDYNKFNNFGGLELIAPKISDNQNMIKNLHETVKCVTLDSYGEDVDFVKMDIEGMEHLALAGAKNLLMKSRPVCFVEMGKTDTEAVKSVFRDADYIAFEYNSNDWIFCPRESDYEIEGHERIVL